MIAEQQAAYLRLICEAVVRPPRTSEEEERFRRFRLPELVLQHRRLSKLLTGFIAPLMQASRWQNDCYGRPGTISCEWNQVNTVTGFDFFAHDDY